ncbi:probably inactive leucine-rich repeat receptor-like protein kinase At5g48380 [Mangifera indica]|uniref:probably inactive leucine-rich repeat receptor-like protein kinase At5g48380 n=1 Tax=Mangifera indica TaxID=29780 RepID=UPI001CFBF8D5|nr:probably inactive leucine-rich repeat receptor-like protein kinase At5g48380 [Mangifera indica]
MELKSYSFKGFSLWILLSCSLSYATEQDIACLKSIKASLEDPDNYLNASWNFNNNTEGYICKFAGVECWHPDENKVLNLSLSDMGLKGKFPPGIANCSSMTGLNLSSNNLYGSLPEDISHFLGSLTSLDLSSNKFSGNIPVTLANCSYLNTLKLDHNQFTGQIPAQLGQLDRLKTFSVANNQLTGQIPQFTKYGAKSEDFASNLGLCGYPLKTSCQSASKELHTGVIAGAAIGGVTFVAIVVAICLFFYYRRYAVKKKKDDDPEGNKWAKSLTGAKGIKDSLFDKSEMTLSDLMKATNSFSKSNIIGAGKTGTMYKAVLDDGSSLMIKRLQHSQRSEKEFLSEMATLGSVKHRNLVPLLGFCMAKQERLLVYKHMANGNVYDNLHPAADGGTPLAWSLRLKIAIGAARGFAWLHHNCNPRIIHGNISSKCIFLDAEFEPKISEFGLARLMNPINTHLRTFVNGESGDLCYDAPEHARTLVATPKGDVYSFGTVLLELVTGEKPTPVAKAPETFKGNLVEWMSQLSKSGQLRDAIDKSLLGKGVDNELFQFLKVACNCVLPEVPKERPTMFELYQFLRAIGKPYNFNIVDQILIPSDIDDADHIEELIVAREDTQ